MGRVNIDHVAVALVRTDHGEVIERSALTGVGLTLSTGSAEPAARGWRVGAGLGSPAAPLDLVLTRTPRGAKAAAARAKLWLTVQATSSAVTAALDLRMLEQAFAASVSAEHWLHAEANIRFDPAAKKTEIILDKVEAGDGAATAEASIDLPDTGDPVVRRAHGDIDVARILRWLPAGMVPATAERARVRYEVASLVVGSPVRLAEGGAASLDTDLSNFAFTAPTGLLKIGGVSLSLHAQPAQGGGIAARGTVMLTGTTFASGEDRISADDLALEVNGQQVADGALGGSLGVRFARAEQVSVLPVVAAGGHVELRIQGLHPNADDPLATRGDVSLAVELASLDVRSPAAHAIVDGLALHAHTLLDGHAPYAAEIEAPMSRLRVIDPRGKLLVDAPARIEVRVHDVQPNLVHPEASSAIVKAAVDLGDVHVSLDATKAVDAVDYTFGTDTKSLRAVRPFLTPQLIAQAPWDRMAVKLRLSGHVDHLTGAGLAIRHTTELDVENPAFDAISARSISLTLKSQGTAMQHQADLDLRAPGLTVNGGSPSDDHVTLSATVDRERPSVEVKLATEGRATTKLAASLSFDPSRRALAFGIDGHLAGLAPLTPFAAKAGLDSMDLSQLEVDLSAHGAILGVLAGVTGDGAIKLEPSPARTAAVEGKVDLRLDHVHWSKGDNAVLTPSLAWHGEMHAAGERRTVESRIDVGSMHLDLGSHDVDLNGISDVASASFIGNLLDPEIELTQRLAVHAIAQDFVPEYPLGDFDFSLTAERGREGVIHLTDLKIANGVGGTTLAVTGNVNLGEGRRTISVTTSLTQDLARLSTIPDRFKGRGKLAVEANVTSPDLAHYKVRAAVKGEDVTVTLPRAGIDLDTANGEVPITVALEVGTNGVALSRSEKRSPYSMLRFADQHPLLSRSGFLSIASLKTPFVTIAPLVGNLEIEQNVISLRQFEMGVHKGTITGQCGIEWDGPRSTLELHVRASGVQSSHGEPFDGNIAVAISAADRTVEGRAEILRIGERHLLDLLDLQDPLHVDPAINRIRGALAFGYPESLRLVFDHGFASAHLELGGIARLVSIGELRGIPMGPIVDQMLAPILDGTDTKETP